MSLTRPRLNLVRGAAEPHDADGDAPVTRLTNAFSKKVENLTAAVSLHFMHYNFCRVHQTLGTTPAVAAGVSDHVWKLPELIALLEDAEQAVPMKRGRYKPRADSK